MSSSSKDRGTSSGRDDCQIHFDKEGESCVIKIESVGQEKMLKELLTRLNSFKEEFHQLLTGQQKPKEMLDAIQEIAVKLKPLENQLEKITKNLADENQQINRFNSDLNKKIEEMKQQMPAKNDFKPVLDAIQHLQSSFEKEKNKPDVLARKLDSIDQKLKEAQPEHTAMIKDIQTKIDPLHKSSPQTSETLMKINDRVKALHAESSKLQPDLMKKLDDIEHRLKDQNQQIVEPVKQLLNEKLNPLLEQQKIGLVTKRDGEDKLGSTNLIDRDNRNPSPSPTRVPLCINGMIPVLSNLSHPHVLAQFAAEIAKKLNDLQTKFPSNDEIKRKQDQFLDQMKQQQQKDSDQVQREMEKNFQPVTQKLNVLAKQEDLLKNIESKLNHLTQNFEKENEMKRRSDPQVDLTKEISNRTQPLMEAIKELPKKFDEILQSDLNNKLNPLTQSIQSLKENFDSQSENKDRENPNFANLEKKFQQFVNDSQKKQSDLSGELDKALQPFSQILRNLKENLDKSQSQQENELKKFDDLQTRLAKVTETSTKPSEMLNPLMNKFNELNPSMKKLSDDVDSIKTLINNKFDPIQQVSRDSIDMKKNNDDLNNKVEKLVEPLTKVENQLRHINEKLDQITPNDPKEKSSIADLNNTLKKFDDQFNRFSANTNEIPRQLDSIKDALDKLKKNANVADPIRAVKEIEDRLKHLDETMKDLPEQITSKFPRAIRDDQRSNTTNLRQVPLSQSTTIEPNQLMTSTEDGEKANLFTNLLTLEAALQHCERRPSQDIQQYLKRVEQSPLVRNDRDLQGLVQRVMDSSMNNNQSPSMNNDLNKGTNQRSIPSSNIDQQNAKEKLLPPTGYLTKSRYIPMLTEEIIRRHWPKLSSRTSPVIESILNQPYDFDNGTSLDRLIKQQGLEQNLSLTRNAIDQSNKDYDQICYMMDSIVFDQMTMIGSREAMIRQWDPSLLNRTSSKGSYPFPSGSGRMIDRFPVNKEIALWMVETDDTKPYKPSEFLPNLGRLNEKYDRIQQPEFQEIRQRKREDETHWNERYAFTKDNRTATFVNDLRSYFMDYDTKRKYQVHDGVPINPVCRTGIAGRGDLPFWGPNHCVVVILLRNPNEPEVVLMRHHGDALLLPKGFYGHEARYDNQMKIVQDPVSGQILPPHLFDYWWSQVSKYNEKTNSTQHLKRVLNEKELKEEFAEIFSQKGCNKSVFDNGYVDHPLNTDHAWVESSVWKIQFKDWRIPEMRSAKYAVALEDGKTSQSSMSFIWMKLIDALLVVPPFDRGLLVDVLATGMPL